MDGFVFVMFQLLTEKQNFQFIQNIPTNKTYISEKEEKKIVYKMVPFVMWLLLVQVRLGRVM